MGCMKKIYSFGKTHGIRIVILVFLVIAAYANAIGNDFISDDIPGIVENPLIAHPQFITSSPLIVGRYLMFYLIHSIFGMNPSAFRMLNIFFHLGSVICLYAVGTKNFSRNIGFTSATG